MQSKRALLWASILCLAALAGCGKTYIDEQREQASQRWAHSRAEMVTKLAEGCFARGEYGRARQQIDDVVRGGVPYAPLYVLAARLAAEKGELDNARSFAEMAKAVDPKSADARYVLGTIEQSLGQSDLAMAEYSEAVELDPTQPRFALAEAELLVSSGQPGKAARQLMAAAERMPGRAEVHAALGDVLVVQRRHAEAVPSYRTAIRLEPKRSEWKERLASALFRAGNWAEAEPMLADLIESEPAFSAGWALGMQGDCLLALGRPSEARPAFARQAEMQPDSAGARVGLAKCDVLQDRLPSARRFLEEALARDSQHPEANALMGYVLVSVDRHAEAVRHLTVALRDPNCAGRETVERLLAVARDSASITSPVDVPAVPANPVKPAPVEPSSGSGGPALSPNSS